MSEKSKKLKRRFSGRLAIFITLLLLVCAILFLSNYLGSASLRRLSYWVFDGVKGDGIEATIKFDENSSNILIPIDRSLGVISPETISVYELSGDSVLSSPALLRTPAASFSDSLFIAYDLGGLNFYLADEDEILFSGAADSKILNASINSSGDFALITDNEDCKSLVTVYDSDFETIYKFHSSEKYVFDVAIAPDSDIVAILTYGTTDGNFETQLSLCKTDETSFYSTSSLGTSMPLKVAFLSDNKIGVICDDRALIYETNGKVVSEFSYNNLPLLSFSVASENHISLLLDNSISDEKLSLILINSDGSSKEKSISGEVYSLSAADEYTAVLFPEECVVYDENLSVHCSVKTSPNISQCIVNNDGSVLLLGDNSATFFVK